MAKSIIAAGKKRVMLTLTESRVTHMQSLFREANLPLGTLSNIVDDYLQSMIAIMEKVKGKGGLNLSDFLMMAGQQMELNLKEEEKERGENKRRETVPVKKATVKIIHKQRGKGNQS